MMLALKMFWTVVSGFAGLMTVELWITTARGGTIPKGLSIYYLSTIAGCALAIAGIWT